MGRLIDADDFLKKAIEERRFFIYHEDIIHGGFEVRTVYKDLIDAINEAPTIEAEPVKHGKWEFGRENGASGYWCSNCKSGFAGENAEWIAKEHNYCPKCGARMDGE